MIRESDGAGPVPADTTRRRIVRLMVARLVISLGVLAPPAVVQFHERLAEAGGAAHVRLDDRNAQLVDQKSGAAGEADARLRFAALRFDVETVDGDRAGAWLQKAGQHFHDRGLSGAVVSEKTDDLAIADGETHIVYSGERAIVARQVTGDNHGLLQPAVRE